MKPIGLLLALWLSGQVMLPHRRAISAAATSDTPPYSTNLIVWLNAATIPLSEASSVTNWPDSGPYAWNFTSGGTFTTLLSNQINGRPAVQFTNPGAGGFNGAFFNTGFSGGAGGVSSPFSTNSSYYSFLVIKADSGDNFGGDNALQLFSNTGTPSGTWFGDHLRDQITGNMVFSYYAHPVRYNCGKGVVNWTNTWIILDVHSAPNDWALYLNNHLQFSTNVNTVSSGDASSGGSAIIGSAAQNSGNPVRYFTGLMAEVLMYKNLPDRTVVYQWLTNRYAITSP